MLKELEYVLKKISADTGEKYTCSEWENYGKHRIYVSKNGESQGYINLDNMAFWSKLEDYYLDMKIERFLKYYGKNKGTLLNDVKKVLDKIQQKDSNSDALYTAEKRDNKIIITKSYWYNQKSGEDINEIVLGEIDLEDLSYILPYSNQPWLVQHEIFNRVFYVEIISKLGLYADENAIENLDW